MGWTSHERIWFWATLALSSITVVAIVFAAWEIVEYHFFSDVDYVTFRYLCITRSIFSSLLLAFWAGWYVLRLRRRGEEELRRSREHYRGLLEASPGAIALYDASLTVAEWNAAAERLYGFGKAEILGRVLPTVPQEKAPELQRLLQTVLKGTPVLDVETLRRHKEGGVFEVQLNLLSYRDSAGRSYILEVATDIRERLRLQRTLLEVEKFTSMGKMAAGTAHHLNTPLAAMLLRVQMMSERRAPCGARTRNCADTQDCLSQYARDLDGLEAGIRLCHHFVRRLLEFSRPAPVERQPERLAPIVQSVLGFLAPQIASKRAGVPVDLSAAGELRVFADRNLLEALFLILLSNALDAIAPGGTIAIRLSRPSADTVQIDIEDNGQGVSEADLPHIFEPFFSTKKPGGTGLGLAIARNIVREHAGSVRLQSAEGRGATVTVTLPVERPAGIHVGVGE